MARSINYESTIAPESLQTLGTGPNAANLGKRNSTALALAFDTPSAPPEGDGGAPRSSALLELARRKMAEYTGENPMFPQYRRNFVPAAAAGGTLTEEYVGVRNKTMSPDEVNNLKLGTPYSPTIASPGVQHNLDPAGLASVASTVNGVVYSHEGGPLAVALDPDSASHQNRDTDQDVTNIGSVRRFKLGVGSGGADEVAARGQFSNT